MTYADVLARIERGERLYIRYSRSLDADVRRGYSIDHQTGQAHAGLSAERLVPADPVIWPDADAYARMQIVSYAHMLADATMRAWIVTGREVGTDSDGAPVLRDVRLVGELSRDEIRPLRLAETYRQVRRETAQRYGMRWRHMTDTQQHDAVVRSLASWGYDDELITEIIDIRKK